MRIRAIEETVYVDQYSDDDMEVDFALTLKISYRNGLYGISASSPTPMTSEGTDVRTSIRGAKRDGSGDYKPPI
jgi:hypothetical protein